MSPRAASRLESLGFNQVYDYKAGKRDWFAFGLPRGGSSTSEPRLDGVLHRDAPSCSLSDSVAGVRKLLGSSGWDWCAVVNESRVLLGRLRASELPAGEGVSAEEAMEAGPSTYRPDAPLGEILERMQKDSFDLVFVTDPEGRFLGTARKDEIETAVRGRSAGSP